METLIAAPENSSVTRYETNGTEETLPLYNYDKLTIKDKYTFFLGGNIPRAVVDTGTENAPSLLILRDMEAHSEEIDDVIRANLKGWTIARVPRVSLVALRVALAEMMYGEEKKTSVAINEAVELVKKYGSDKDYQFVNGLLGTVARAQDKPAEE